MFGAEEAKKGDGEAALPAAPAAKGAAEEKAAVPVLESLGGDAKALVVFENVNKPTEKNTRRNSNERDIALAKLETEKRNSLIKAREENEKTKAENKAAKKISAILSWENTKKAIIDAQLKKKEEELEKKKAEYTEKMKNKMAIIHRLAEEKRTMAMALRGEEVLKAEEMAAKYHATGTVPKKSLGCFGA